MYRKEDHAGDPGVGTFSLFHSDRDLFALRKMTQNQDFERRTDPLRIQVFCFSTVSQPHHLSNMRLRAKSTARSYIGRTFSSLK
jgi:hypothetical protein